MKPIKRAENNEARSFRWPKNEIIYQNANAGELKTT